MVYDISLFHDRDRFSCESTLIDKSTSFKKHTFEGDFDWVFEKNDVSRHQIYRGDFDNFSVSECLDFDLIIGHFINFLIEAQQLIDCDSYCDDNRTQNDAGIDIVDLIVPQTNAEEQKHIEWSQQFFDENEVPSGLLDLHCALPVATSQLGDLLRG